MNFVRHENLLQLKSINYICLKRILHARVNCFVTRTSSCTKRSNRFFSFCVEKRKIAIQRPVLTPKTLWYFRCVYKISSYQTWRSTES